MYICRLFLARTQLRKQNPKMTLSICISKILSQYDGNPHIVRHAGIPRSNSDSDQITVVKDGIFFVVEGNTYPHKEKLKAAGFRYWFVCVMYACMHVCALINI